jgi:2'-5' RNA ligase
MWEAP